MNQSIVYNSQSLGGDWLMIDTWGNHQVNVGPTL